MQFSEAAVVTKENAQTLRKHLEELNVWDPSHRLTSISDTDLAIPLLSDHTSLEQYRSGGKYNINGVQFSMQHISLQPSRKAKKLSPYSKLVEKLRSLIIDHRVDWTMDLAGDIPQRWEFHGDLVLLPGDCFQRPEWLQTVPALWHSVCEALGARKVAQKSSITQDDYRSPQVQLLFGEDGWVQHMDNGIQYQYDVTRCMFSAGNITEKLRIASFDCKGETVVDLFAGIGYFTLPYLVHAGADRVYACEWNPDAVEALGRNLLLNKVGEKCTVLQGDNRETCPRGVADRVNLGLIPSSECSWKVACRALKPSGGVLHIHANVTSGKHPSEIGVDGSTCPIESEMKQHLTGTDFTDMDNFTKMENIDCRENSENFGDLDLNESKGYSCRKETKEEADKHHSVEGSADELCTVPTDAVCTSTELTLDVNELSDNLNGESSSVSQQRTTKCKFQKNTKCHPDWTVWANGVSRTISKILCELHGGSWEVVVMHTEHVKSYAPHVDHLVLDLDCRPGEM